MRRLSIPWLALMACSAGLAQDIPKAEMFLGYNYIRVNSATSVPSYNSHGGSGQLAINLHRYFSLVADLGGYNNNNVGGAAIDNTLFSYLFGPRVSMRNQSRVTPYVNALFGGAYLTASTAVSPTPASSTANARQYLSQNAFAMAIGGGLDIRVSKYVSLRPAGLDYFMMRLQNPASLQDNNQHHFRYSAGINFTFDRESPAPLPAPPQKTCWDGSSVLASPTCPNRTMDVRIAASDTKVCPGTVVRITPSGAAEGATLDWSVNGQPAGRSSSHEFSTAGLTPGVYNIALTAAASTTMPQRRFP